MPDGVDPATVPKPLSPDVAKHVAAVVLFGTPNVRAMNFLGQPPVVIGPVYQAKTIKVCVPEDPVCSDGLNFAAHDTYATDSNFIDTGADFAASRLGGPPPAAPPPAPGLPPIPGLAPPPPPPGGPGPDVPPPPGAPGPNVPPGAPASPARRTGDSLCLGLAVRMEAAPGDFPGGRFFCPSEAFASRRGVWLLRAGLARESLAQTVTSGQSTHRIPSFIRAEPSAFE